MSPRPLPFRDPSLPTPERVEDLLARMTPEEKCSQLVGVWVDVSPDGGVAPLMDQTIGQLPPFEELTRHGLGQLTRVFGTTPVEPAEAAAALGATQRDLVSRTRLGIPAVAHEECLTGFTAWRASVFPTPLAWGSAWDPDTVQQMAAAIGRSMRRVGVHQGLAPVLDVVRDLRWGRVEECIAEDPYLVGQVGAAYVRGLEGAGVVATLKHFAGYSASRSGRNLAPVHAGPREREDVFLPPFETALREGGARSVMNSYAEVDGLPAAADPGLLTGVLRERWGFTGTVVADYFAIAFLVTQHGVAADDADAAALALGAGIDVELPTARCYLDPLVQRVRDGLVDEALVDRALRRVLAQKIELGLLDEDWDPLVQQAGP
ncbi:MAG: glycoside hydrolase family 3 protein, partial [Motilibacteraceae bacterium]